MRDGRGALGSPLPQSLTAIRLRLQQIPDRVKGLVPQRHVKMRLPRGRLKRPCYEHVYTRSRKKKLLQLLGAFAFAPLAVHATVQAPAEHLLLTEAHVYAAAARYVHTAVAAGFTAGWYSRLYSVWDQTQIWDPGD